MAQEREDLQQDDDYPDARHEAGYHRVGGEGYETADPQHAQEDLYDPSQDDDCERPGEVVGVSGDDDGHHHCHGAGGSGYLGTGSAEDRREEADGYGPVDSREGSKARGHTESESDREAHYCRGHAAKDIAAEGLEVVANAWYETT